MKNAATRAGDGAQASEAEKGAGVLSHQGRGDKVANAQRLHKLQPRCILIRDKGRCRLEKMQIGGAREVNMAGFDTGKVREAVA